jgi:hypothetical protein
LVATLSSCGSVNQSTDAACSPGSEGCACLQNGGCHTGLTCSSGLCLLLTGVGGKGGGGAAGAAGTTGGGGAAGTGVAGTTGSAGAAGAGTAGTTGSAGAAGAGTAGASGAGGARAGAGGGGAGGRGGAGGTGTAGASGAAGGGSSGSAGHGGASAGSGGSGGAAAGTTGAAGAQGGTTGAAGAQGGTTGAAGAQGGTTGGAGAGGGAGGPCLQLLTSAPQITAAMQGLTMASADFDHDASGNTFVFQVVAGDDFATHALVTFQSVDTSNQAAVGTVSGYVVAKPPSAICSSSTAAVAYSGFDGIRSLFASPQMVVGLTGNIPTGSPADSFVLAVGRSDVAGTTTFALPTTMAPLAGVRSNCGAIITSIDVLPDQIPTGDHQSTFWTLTSLTFAH